MLYDKIIIGAGFYGLYAAISCGRRGQKVLVLEADDEPFMRATYINQARVHMGYHYPRSYSTAIKSAGYFRRFNEDYGFCVHKDFQQIYATSADLSWTDAEQFHKFCQAVGIRCEEVPVDRYFKPGMCDGAFLTEEHTYDAQILKAHLLEELGRLGRVTLQCGCRITGIERGADHYRIRLADGTEHSSGFVLNASYASVDQILSFLGAEPFKIKYELCEIILCDVGDSLRDVGITVMDGPFFSIMPFGRTGLHSLTSVAFTPHMTCRGDMPVFPCQEGSGGYCSPQVLGNCDSCPSRPATAWPYMSGLARKYLREGYGFTYRSSLFSMKPVLRASEIDDSRPTVIRYLTEDPTFVSVLSGKINTVYDLDEVLR